MGHVVLESGPDHVTVQISTYCCLALEAGSLNRELERVCVLGFWVRIGTLWTVAVCWVTGFFTIETLSQGVIITIMSA